MNIQEIAQALASKGKVVTNGLIYELLPSKKGPIHGFGKGKQPTYKWRVRIRCGETLKREANRLKESNGDNK